MNAGRLKGAKHEIDTRSCYVLGQVSTSIEPHIEHPGLILCQTMFEKRGIPCKYLTSLDLISRNCSLHRIVTFLRGLRARQRAVGVV